MTAKVAAKKTWSALAVVATFIVLQPSNAIKPKVHGKPNALGYSGFPFKLGQFGCRSLSGVEANPAAGFDSAQPTAPQSRFTRRRLRLRSANGSPVPLYPPPASTPLSQRLPSPALSE